MVQFSQQPPHSCRRILFFLVNSSLFLAFVWLFINLMTREHTLVHGFATRFCFVELTLGGDRVQVPFKYYLHGCQRMAPRLLLPWILLLFNTLRPREKDGSEGVAALWSGCCARYRHSHAGNCTGLLSTTGHFLSTGNRYLFLLQRHSFPFDY